VLKHLGRLPRRQKLQTRAGVLEAVVSGTGVPTLLLVNGAGVTLEGWRALYPAIEHCGTVFAWNRFGAGGSDRPRLAQTGAVVVASLRELLGYAGLQPPYLLVAHSLGGLYANLFARLHPAEVCGMVLLEATHPRDKEMLKAHEGRLAAVLGKLFALPQQMFRANLHSEIGWIDETVRQIDAAGPFPGVPLVVVTGGRDPPGWLVPPAALRIRREHQRDLARLSPRGEQVIAAGSGHFPQLSEPRLVLDAIGRVAAQAGFRTAAGPGG
jgi:pimeloyl-ACP methyl ester carboxylesterase